MLSVGTVRPRVAPSGDGAGKAAAGCTSAASAMVCVWGQGSCRGCCRGQPRWVRDLLHPPAGRGWGELGLVWISVSALSGSVEAPAAARHVRHWAPPLSPDPSLEGFHSSEGSVSALSLLLMRGCSLCCLHRRFPSLDGIPCHPSGGLGCAVRPASPPAPCWLLGLRLQAAGQQQ